MSEVTQFLKDPIEYFGSSATKIQTTDPRSLESLQLEAMKHRFAQMRDSIPMLKRLADEQNITSIDSLNDVLPVLFTHETYKSYPASLLQKGRFGQLMKWVAKLTTAEFAKSFENLDVSSCKNIDEWLLLLKRESDLLLCHSSGTSGTMSFLPWSRAEIRSYVRWFAINCFQEFGDENASPITFPLNIPCVYPHYRSGGSIHLAANDFWSELIAGGDHNFHAAFPGRLSSDLLLLAARLRAAEAKGTVDEIEISPDLSARRAEFAAEQREMPTLMAQFIDTMRVKLGGQRVYMQTTSNLLYLTAVNGLKQGIRNVFNPASVIICGGGGKGMVLPDNWMEPVLEYFGVKRLHQGYGMSETSGAFFQCEHGHFHTTPWMVPFVLDPATAQPLARTGVTTGRYAFFDLMPWNHWGGFITGDEVTVNWDAKCPCGRTTTYLQGKIQRLSEKAGFAEDDEKISCAATPAAYANALDFLTGVKE